MITPASTDPSTIDRRTFLRSALAVSAGAAAVPLGAVASSAATEEGPSPYGPIEDRDGSGLLLPEGFRARVIAVAGSPIGPGGYEWPGAADGAATFDDGDGGWYHTINHELDGPGGGVSTIHYDPDGEVIDAYEVLTGTARNCAGGPTPWGTWLSCEEVGRGLVYECDPTGPGQGTAIPALGRFKHEAVAVDPVRRQLYLTEDEFDGLLYRFTPAAYPALTDGLLEAASLDGNDVAWVPVPDPGADGRAIGAQFRTGEVQRFDGGEGIWYHEDHVWFTTKGDGRVWGLDVEEQVLGLLWDPDWGPTLRGVDNVTVENGSGDLYVAEDGGNMELVIISAEGTVAPFLRIAGHGGSEVTGPVFNPAGDRLYLSSQRGADGRGVTYEITGPFRGPDRVGSSVPDRRLAAVPTPGHPALARWPRAVFALVFGAVLLLVARLRNRNRATPSPEPAGADATDGD